MSIPRHIHMFWCGEPPGKLEIACLRSVRRHHPKWKISIYGFDFSSSSWQPFQNLANLVIFKIHDSKLRNIFETSSYLGIKSDIVRYFTLHHHGGIWLDFDVVCLRSLDFLCRHKGFAATESFGVLGTAVFGTKAGSEVTGQALELIPEVFDPANKLCLGPSLLTHCVLDCGADWCIMEPEAFYPLRWNQAGKKLDSEAFKDSFTIHLWNSLRQMSSDIWQSLSAIAPEFKETGYEI